MKTNIKTKITELRYISQLLYNELSRNSTYINNDSLLALEEKYLITDAQRDAEDIANLFAYLDNKVQKG